MTCSFKGCTFSEVTNMRCMFYGCGLLNTLTGEEAWDVSSLTTMYCMFSGCRSLRTGINDPRDGGLFLENWDPYKVREFYNTFYQCGTLTSLNLSRWGSKQPIKTSSSLIGMFQECGSLEEIYLPNWDTSETTSMGNMFRQCHDLRTIVNLEQMNVSKAWSMSYMFYSCDALTELDLSSWDTAKLTNPSGMFYSCDNSRTVNVSNWNTAGVTSMYSMFIFCGSLTSVIGLEGWNTSNVLNMASMFQDCRSLTSLNLSNWDMTKVGSDNKGTMYSMFSACSVLNDIGRSTITVANGCPVLGCADDSPIEDKLTIKSVNGQILQHKRSSRSAVQALQPAAAPSVVESPAESPLTLPEVSPTGPEASETPRNPMIPAAPANPDVPENTEAPANPEAPENTEAPANSADSPVSGDSLVLVQNAPPPCLPMTPWGPMGAPSTPARRSASGTAERSRRVRPSNIPWKSSI